MRDLLRILLSGCLSVAALAQGASSCDCGKPDDGAVSGNYFVKGTYLLRSRGAEGVKEHLMKGVFQGKVYVSPRGAQVSTTPLDEITMDGMAAVETFAGSASRPEPRKGKLEGSMSLSPALLYLKGEDMSFRISITHVDCSKVSGVLVLDEETPLELREAVEAEGLQVVEHTGTFEATLDRDTRKDMDVTILEKRCGTVDVTHNESFYDALVSGLAVAKSLNPRDPYEKCLQQRAFRALGCMASRRAQWMVAQFTGPRPLGTLQAEVQYMRAVVSAINAAESLGCTLPGAMAALARQFGAWATGAARRGARASDLADLAAIAQHLGFEGAQGEGILDAINAAAQSSGYAAPFSVP